MFKLEKLTDKAVLTIYGYVGGSYLDFRAVNSALDDVKKSGYKNLDFWLHTYGGDVFEGNMICNFLESFNGEIDFWLPGVAASMGAIIIRSGDRVHMAENAFQMIHAPSGGSFGSSKQLTQASKLLASMEKNFVSKLMAATGKPESEVNKWMDGTDYWFDADECIKLGLATNKFSPKDKLSISLDKTEASLIGAKAVFDKFSALAVESQLSKKNTSEAYETDKSDWTWNDYQKKAVSELEEMQQTNPSKLKALYKAEFGVEPEFNNTKKGMIVVSPANSHETDKSDWTWNDYQKKAVSELEEMQQTNPAKLKALYKAEFGVELELK